MATTFTILAVFLPVGFMTGIVGQFFKSFALTIAFAVAMSLLVAFTLDPMLSSRFVRYIPPEERMRTRTGRILERGAVLRPHRPTYHGVLAVGARHPVEGGRIGGGDLLREPVDAWRSSAPSSCRRGSRRVPGHRRAAARHVVRRERRARSRRSRSES